jgi:polyisoprenyl-phosphate glycosyltransferase
MTGTSPTRVSVVVPVLDEAPTVAALVDRFDEIRDLAPEYRFEFVVVDDGSTDGTVDLMAAHAETRDDLRVIVLSRNFGSHYAISAGLAEARGRCVIVIGADLQEPPELIRELLDAWRDGSDIVWGVRRTRAGQRRVGRLVSNLFARLLHRFSELKTYPVSGPSVFLITDQVSEVIQSMEDRHRNVLGLIAWSGFTQSEVLFDQRPRASGRSKWSRSSKLKLAVDSFVAFSFAPVRFMSYSGLVIALAGFVYAGVLLVRRLVVGPVVEGWTTVVVVVLVIGGFQLLMLGVLGEYVWRNADEARRRPLYVVRERLPRAARSSEPSEQAPSDADRT